MTEGTDFLSLFCMQVLSSFFLFIYLHLFLYFLPYIQLYTSTDVCCIQGFSKYDLCASCHAALPDSGDHNFLHVPVALDRDLLPQASKAIPSSITTINS